MWKTIRGNASKRAPTPRNHSTPTEDRGGSPCQDTPWSGNRPTGQGSPGDTTGLASTYASKPDDYHGHLRTDVIDMIDFEPSSLLEPGCSAGGTARTIRERFGACRLTGVELTGPAADRAETILDRVIQGDNSQLREDTFPADAFDLVICADVLEHLIDPWDTLRKVHR